MKRLILLIDDDHDEFMILQEALSIANLNSDCLWAANLDEAMQLLTQQVPNYIFIDLNMPRTNGLECLNNIKDMQQLQAIPVVMYSTTISPSTQATADAKGARCLEKQASLRMLAHKLTQLVA